VQEICIIGPKKSGKTTYLATLLRLPDSLTRRYPGLRVAPSDDNAEKLSKNAAEILESGRSIHGTDLSEGDEPFYTFQIDLPKTKGLNKTSLEVTVRDYAGEVIQIAASEPDKLKPYVQEWCKTTSWMILLSDWQPERDGSLYEPAFKEILRHVSEARAKNQSFDKLLRVAVVMTKCERGEIWPCRLDPEEDLFKVRLPKTHALLQQNLSQRLKFFACSSFGVLNEHHDPRPNRNFDSDNPEAKAYLKDYQSWCPYGLFSPIYWLCTGKTLYDESL
jgi:Double-GTPase 1